MALPAIGVVGIFPREFIGSTGVRLVRQERPQIEVLEHEGIQRLFRITEFRPQAINFLSVLLDALIKDGALCLRGENCRVRSTHCRPSCLLTLSTPILMRSVKLVSSFVSEPLRRRGACGGGGGCGCSPGSPRPGGRAPASGAGGPVSRGRPGSAGSFPAISRACRSRSAGGARAAPPSRRSAHPAATPPVAPRSGAPWR